MTVETILLSQAPKKWQFPLKFSAARPFLTSLAAASVFNKAHNKTNTTHKHTLALSASIVHVPRHF